jgi:hypothetical protein
MKIIFCLCWVDIDIIVTFGLLYLLMYFFWHQIDRCHNITIVLELT